MQLDPSQTVLGLFDVLETAKSEAQMVGVLNQIRELSEPSGLPFMFGWLQHEHAAVREAASQAVSSMLEPLTPQMIPILELFIRESWVRYVTRGAEFRATGLPSLLLASLDPNGRIRECSLRKLLHLPDAAILPFMLLRLNDWVPGLRRLADDWLARHAQHLPTSELVRVIPILAAIADRRNSSVSGQLPVFAQRLQEFEAVPLLVAAIPTSDSRSRRYILHLLSASGALADECVQWALIHSRDPFAGVLCLDALEKCSVPVSRDALIAAVKAKSVMLRNKALQLWQARRLGGLTAVLEERLLDESATVRQFARYWLLQERPGLEFTPVYRAAMQDNPPRKVAAALAGYHECGAKLEHEDYVLWVQHPASIVRRVALRCFAAAMPEAAQPVVRQFALEGIDPTLRGTAFRIIQSHRRWLTLEEIASLVLTGQEIGLRLKALSLLRREEKWHQLPVLLRLLSGDDEELRPAILTALRDWSARFNLSWTQPTKENVADARRWLAAAASRLGKHQLHDLENLLSTVRTPCILPSLSKCG
jgi:hypothetical protein